MRSSLVLRFFVPSRVAARMSMNQNRVLLGATFSVLVYVLSYTANSFFGGYDPYWESDGSQKWAFTGFLVRDSIMWQPRFGSYSNKYRHDALGVVFYPLIWIDRKLVHPTRAIQNEDFGLWWANLPDSQVHPRHREEFRSWKQSGI